MNNKNNKNNGSSCLALILLWLIITSLSSWILTSIWNWLLVDLFNFPVITFWEGCGIVILLRLIGSFFKK